MSDIGAFVAIICGGSLPQKRFESNSPRTVNHDYPIGCTPPKKGGLSQLSTMLIESNRYQDMNREYRETNTQ